MTNWQIRVDREIYTVFNEAMRRIKTKNTNSLTGIKRDIQSIKKRLDNTATKDDLRDLEKKIAYLPTKGEFYNSMDKVMGELKAIREENIVLSYMKRQVNDHEDRIEMVEEKLNIPLPA